MKADLLAEVMKLSPSERRELIAVVWDTPSEDDVSITPEETALLDECLADLEANLNAHSPWSEVQARLEHRRR